MRVEAKKVGDRLTSKYGNVIRVIDVKEDGRWVYICETCCKEDLELWGVKRESCKRGLYDGCPSTCNCGKNVIRSIEQLLLIARRNAKGKGITIELKEVKDYTLHSIIVLTDDTGLYEEVRIGEEVRFPSKGNHNKKILDSTSNNNNKIVCLERGDVRYTCTACKGIQEILGRYYFTQTRSQFVKCKDSCFCGRKRRTREEYLILCKREIERLGGKFLRIGKYTGKGTKIKWESITGEVKSTELKDLKQLSATGSSNSMHFPEGFRIYKGKENSEDYLYLIKVLSDEGIWYKMGRSFNIKNRFYQHEIDFKGKIVHYEVYKGEHEYIARFEEFLINNFSYYRKKEMKEKSSKKIEIFPESTWEGLSQICKINDKLVNITKEIVYDR